VQYRHAKDLTFKLSDRRAGERLTYNVEVQTFRNHKSQNLWTVPCRIVLGDGGLLIIQSLPIENSGHTFFNS
jgi:hypothetical protein